MTTTMKMSANYFAERHYVKTNIKRGVAHNPSGTRILSLTSDFLLGLRNALIFECGKASDAVMKTAGKKWGISFATRLHHELSNFYGSSIDELPLAMFQANLAQAFSHHGFGRLTIEVNLYDKGLIIAIVENPVYAELVENPDQPTDPLLAGIFAGIFSHMAHRDLDCVQTQCQGCGAADSRFIIGIPARLEEVETWRNDGQSHVEIVAALAQLRIEE